MAEENSHQSVHSNDEPSKTERIISYTALMLFLLLTVAGAALLVTAFLVPVPAVMIAAVIVSATLGGLVLALLALPASLIIRPLAKTKFENALLPIALSLILFAVCAAFLLCSALLFTTPMTVGLIVTTAAIIAVPLVLGLIGLAISPSVQAKLFGWIDRTIDKAGAVLLCSFVAMMALVTTGLILLSFTLFVPGIILITIGVTLLISVILFASVLTAIAKFSKPNPANEAWANSSFYQWWTKEARHAERDGMFLPVNYDESKWDKSKPGKPNDVERVLGRAVYGALFKPFGLMMGYGDEASSGADQHSDPKQTQS